MLVKQVPAWIAGQLFFLGLLGTGRFEPAPFDHTIRARFFAATHSQEQAHMATSSTTSTSTGTVRLHRVLRAPPERVYRAFLDADAKAKWLPPHGFTGKVHESDAKVGGSYRSYRMSFTNFTTGSSHSFGGTYVELVPHERLRYTDRFDDPNLPGEMHVTVSLRKVLCGTELSIVQEGIPAVIPAEMCYLGWQESLTQLAQLVEPEIPDGA
jgi:uncharacterized protein YndB with AHSA1/START domain